MSYQPGKRVMVSSLLVCLWLACCLPARAALELSIQRIATPAVTLARVHLALENSASGQVQLSLTVGQLDMPGAGLQKVGVTLDGHLTRDGVERWLLDGNLAVSGMPGTFLEASKVHIVLDEGANTLDVAVADKTTRVNAALPLDQPSHIQFNMQKLPLRWLGGLLRGVLPGHVTGGQLSGTVALDIAPYDIRSSGYVTLANAAFDANGGKIAGRDLGAHGRFTFDSGAGLLSADLTLHGGQVLLGTFFAALPAHDVHLAVNALSQQYAIAVRQLRFTDPGAVHLVGALVIGNDGRIRNVHLDRFHADLPAAYQRYGKVWLATLGFPDMTTSGSIDGNLWLDSNGVRSLKFDAQDVNIASKRLGVKDLHGGLDWRRGEPRPATELAWDALRYQRIALGPAQIHWQGRKDDVAITAPTSIPVLGGQLRLARFRWDPDAAKGQHLDLSLAATGIDIARLGAALGWPRFPGTLAASIPGLRYRGDTIELDGGLSLNLFGGFIDVTRLSLEHPFGTAPVLTGDITLSQLDLGAVTSVFDFGQITGRLDGRINGLRLVNWKPTAFQASLRTSGDGRISQRAVKNLTSVGGSGLGAGLQGAFMKLFDSFGYSHIGLNCTLKGSVCHMSGLRPVKDGFVIVEGRGLPHLSVIGHQHDVNWPTLVSRLKAAIESGGPVVK